MDNDEIVTVSPLNNMTIQIDGPTWIPVSERLPKNSEDVLIIDDRNRMHVSCYFLSKDYWTWERRDDQIGLGEVTHWMQLPEVPHE